MMSSSSFSYGWKYDVFLSFRGSDTRHGFTGNLYKALCDRGIHTFIDGEELQRGEEITPSLVKAIEESRIAILVFSKNYASSTFCLDELVHILACVKEKGTLVLPVFYEVDPSDVRHQRGSYEEALNSHKERFNHDKQKLQKWRIALRQAADLSGFHFKHGNEFEYEFVGKIIKEVTRKISHTHLHVANNLVGLESRVQQVTSLLDYKYDGVLMVGIHGIGGLGKTTIARAIYNLIAAQFEGFCFLENVRENSVKHGLVHLQETLLSKTLRGKDVKLASVNEGIPKIKHKLHLKKVLLVIDDVDDLEQLHATVGGIDWFGSGSRVIITTRDKHLLTCHGVKSTYEVDGLNMEEALKLLSWTSFKIEKVDTCYVNILNRVVTYASGLPLALIVIGSNLFGKSIQEWESALDQYKRIPNKKIQDILKVSFDSLEEDEQNIFLDIACCFKGYALTYVKEILSSHHGLCPEYAIGVLIGKSLIKVDAGCVVLHDLIEDMGKEIVRQESPREPGKRSRLWFSDDIVKVLEENKGTSRIQMITLNYVKYGGVVEWDGMAFKEMNNLKTLIIRNGYFTEDPSHLPNSLRVLEWQGYPSPSLPTDFNPKKLGTLILQFPQCCLMSLDVLESEKNLTRLGRLELKRCGIVQLPSSIKECQLLTQVHLKSCKNLEQIRGIPPNLEALSVKDCSSLKDLDLTLLPKWTKECRFLKELRLHGCNNLEQIKGIPLSIELLSVECCTSLKEVNLALPPASTQECCILSTLFFDACWGNLQETYRIPSIIRTCSARGYQFSTSVRTSMSLDKELSQRRIVEWLEHCISGSSICFSYQNQFPRTSFRVVAGPEAYLSLGPIFIFDGKKRLLVKELKFAQVGNYVALDQMSHHVVIFYH